MELRVDSDRDLRAWDYVLFALTIGISLGIGVFYALASRRKNNTEEYLVGGRSMGFLPTAISLVASFQSSILMLGFPAEVYLFGLQYIWWSVGVFVSQLLAVNVVVPLFHPLRITSAFEYLERRYNSKMVRLLGSALGIVSNIWYMAIVVYGPAIALEGVAGIPLWVSIVTTSVAAIIYTSIGGIKAVIWTDVFQGLVMLAGIFAILIQGTVKVGGPKKVWDTAERAGRMNFFDFDPDPTIRHTFWTLFLGSIFGGFGLVFNQSSVQRISSTRTVTEANRMLLIAAPVYIIISAVALYEGVVVFSYFQTEGCDPLISQQISNPNQLIPFTVLEFFDHLPGMAGLFLAALYSASLSTLSSGLSSTAAMLWSDIIRPLVGDISESKSTIIIKITVVIFGGVSCAVAFMVAEIGGTLIQIAVSVISAFGGPLTGLFLLGCFFPRSNYKGALVGGIVSLTMCAWISMGQSFSPNIPDPVPLGFASIENCFVRPSLNASDLTAATTPEGLTNFTDSTQLYLQTTTTSAPPAAPPAAKEPSGIEHLYTLSYQYISLVGTLGTIIVGMLVSLITGMNKPGDVDSRYLISASETLLIFLPGPMRRCISSIGTQFMKEEYKTNLDDPHLNGTEAKTSATLDTDNIEKQTNGTFDDLNQSFREGQKQNQGVDNSAFSRL